MGLEKKYNSKNIETKWSESWVKNKTYKWTEHKNPEKNYLIDSPPPYPYTKLHTGNFFNYTYQDLMARYKRQQGFHVLQPMGWDCHGLPAELHVEKMIGKKAEQIGIPEFKKLCEKVLLENIENVKIQTKELGISVDWDKQYITMSDEYKKMVQQSFLDMYQKKYAYRGEHPVSWCTSCHSSIAEAQTDKIERNGTLHYIKLAVKEGGSIQIATTRPELMGSCVALFVHPEDERYAKMIGRTVILPFFNREVLILANKDVDPSFGTGAVYHCTFGDKTDYEWVVKYKLPIIKTLEENGYFNQSSTVIKDLNVTEARKKIVEELKKIGLYSKSAKTKQAISVCERCKTPIEIIVKTQWFFATTKLKKQIRTASKKMKWMPKYMENRLLDWVKNASWDWVISRQRYWATPFPVWHCQNCEKIIIATTKELPIDPTQKDKKCDCGGIAKGETDVMDTWMDSSLSSLRVSKWMKNKRNNLTDLRTQGEDIIKTWIYYSIARTTAYEQQPFNQVLMNGMVLGKDGKKMSKRKQDTMVLPEELIQKYGADAYRQWAGRSIPGQDWPINYSEFEYAKKFLNKLYNLARFSEKFITDKPVKSDNISDKYILNELEKTKIEYHKQMNEAKFGNALEAIRNFTWHEFADYYVELVKYRAYELDEEVAKRVITKVLKEILILLAPFTPFITEEIYQTLFNPKKSIHVQKFSEVNEVSTEISKISLQLKAAITAVRALKNEKNMSLGKQINELIVPKTLSDEIINELKTVLKIKKIKKEKEYQIIS